MCRSPNSSVWQARLGQMKHNDIMIVLLSLNSYIRARYCQYYVCGVQVIYYSRTPPFIHKRCANNRVNFAQ